MSLRYSGRWALPAHGERQAPPGEASALLKTLLHLVDSDGQLTQPNQTGGAVSLEVAYRQCVAITRQHSKSFFVSSQLLPPEKRRAIRALYAFCRTSDDLVDQQATAADRALARWVRLVHAPHAPADDAVLLAWKDTAARYDIPQTLVDELLAGVAMDLTVKRYATFNELWIYCYRVAAVVGLLSMQIIGYRAGATPFAISLGVALQLTNILRDIGEDAARGRIYLPQEDMARFGVTDDDILQARRTDAFRALLQFEIDRAHALYDEAWPGIALLSDDSQFAIAAAADIYRGILAKIVANDYDVYQQRAHLSLADKLLMLPRIRRRVRSLHT